MLGTNQGSGGSRKTFLNISNGKVIQEWKDKPRDEWVPQDRELLSKTITKGVNEGKLRYYVEYDYVSGHITGIELDRSDLGDRIKLTLSDKGDEFILSISTDSAYGESFMQMMNNIDVGAEITVTPWSMTPDQWFDLTGKTVKSNKVGLTIKQLGAKLDKFYTKDNPNGMPQLVQKTVKGKVEWDSTDRDNFLYEELLRFIEKANASVSTSVKNSVLAGFEDDTDDDGTDDDLPF